MTECIDASIIVKWFHKGEAFDAESHILLEKIIESEHDFVVNLAKSIELNYSLYAADAVHIATAIHTNASILWTEDHHMQKESLKELFISHSIEVRSLKGILK
ncbi:MAG: type II toxin-antitoxin system VapC family toxin [Candidatus Methanoperedens sp.]|nr:type II toxin-antitoxin system VapC family toxin [Candidatus Methanoperedens sp.]